MSTTLTIQYPPRDIISANVNVFEGDLLLSCTYVGDVHPEALIELSKGRRVYSFCPEQSHLDRLGLKMCTIFRLNRVTSLTVVTKDGSPHSMQIPLMVQEAAENQGFDKRNITYYCIEGGKLHQISDLAVRKARHYSEIETLLPFARLAKVAEILRGKDGCPNDQKETFQSVIEHLKEEVAEVEQAVANNDTENLVEELGDVLFNIVLFCQIAREKDQFNFAKVANASATKMIDKHPQVFANRSYKY